MNDDSVGDTVDTEIPMDNLAEVIANENINGNHINKVNGDAAPDSTSVSNCVLS